MPPPEGSDFDLKLPTYQITQLPNFIVLTLSLSTIGAAQVLTWKLGAVQVLALGCVGIVAGAWLKRKLPILDRLCIPTSIVGGLLLALVALGLHDRYANFEYDSTLRDLFMIAFMTTIGLNARLDLIRRGGIQVLLMWALASAGAVLQNLLGIGLAKAMGLNPLIGILSGSVALAGGPGTALAFGPTFEKLGVRAAAELGTASAIFGIAVAGLVGGYIGSSLVRRHALQSQPVTAATVVSSDVAPQDAATLLRAVLLIGIAMGLGNLISAGIERLGMVLPPYIGAMIAAAVIRNVNDRFSFFPISQSSVDTCAVISLQLFIVTATLALRLWELAHLILPMVLILAAQVVLCWLMCVTACFFLMGRDYESAVMSSGFCGFMLGVTANAVACMEELVEKFGPAPRSFLVVPLVGAFLIDFANSLIITAMANMVR
jgi:glutamate:Na+ symporter, ESS family